MKTQILFTLIFLAGFLMISNNIASVSNSKRHQQVTASKSIEPGKTKINLAGPFHVSLENYEEKHEAHKHSSGNDDENSFHFFHFERICRSNKYFRHKVVACKLLLSLIHIIVFLASCHHIILIFGELVK